MKICYLGENSESSTSLFRANALRRLRHNVVHVNPSSAFSLKPLLRIRSAIHYRSGYVALQSKMIRWARHLKAQFPEPFDLIWVDSGELLGPEVLAVLNTMSAWTVLYNHDDPTGERDGGRFRSLRSALPLYDHCAVVRKENLAEYRMRGARSVQQVWRSYDEIAHAPYAGAAMVDSRFCSEVAFVGTWIPGEARDEFLFDLMRMNVPISVWGDGWQRSPRWSSLKTAWRGPSIGGRDYVAAIQGSKLALGLLSKGNRDLHTTRSAEIPYAGGLLCAQRTTDHLALYRDGDEAVFWDDAQECAAVCHALLGDSPRRESIRAAGRERVLANSVGNEDVLSSILTNVARLPERGR